ncbi:MAG: pectate lyase, partial [Bacteroidales bacterium]|nr:pectate lyase [Bacteroidales bacterium]
GEADVDSDNDGMPDWFEEQFGLDSTKNDSTGYDLDKYGRYTNIEMYAHYLVKDIVKGQIASGTYTALD